MTLLVIEEHKCWAQVKEVALMHSEGLLAGEMKHGPLALVDEHLPLIVIATRDRMYAKMLSVVHQLLARGARLIILCNAGDTEIQETCASHNCRLIEVRLPGWHLIRPAPACHLLRGRGHLSLGGWPCTAWRMCCRSATQLGRCFRYGACSADQLSQQRIAPGLDSWRPALLRRCPAQWNAYSPLSTLCRCSCCLTT